MAQHDDAPSLSEVLTTVGGDGLKDLLRDVVRDALQDLIEDELAERERDEGPTDPPVPSRKGRRSPTTFTAPPTGRRPRRR